MSTLDAEIRRIKSAVADITSKTFTGETLFERYNTITMQEYDACEQVWNDLYRKKRQLQKELQQICREIEAVEIIMIRPIKGEK